MQKRIAPPSIRLHNLVLGKGYKVCQDSQQVKMIGIVRVLRLPRVPDVVERLHLHVAFSGYHGKGQVHGMICCAHGNLVLARQTEAIDCTSQHGVIDCVFSFERIKILDFGEHTVRAEIDDYLLGEKPFEIGEAKA